MNLLSFYLLGSLLCVFGLEYKDHGREGAKRLAERVLVWPYSLYKEVVTRL